MSKKSFREPLSKGGETSVDCSDQAAVSSEHLNLFSILVPRRLGFPQLDAVTFRGVFIRPEAEVQAGNQEDPVQGCGGPRVIPGELFRFRREHVKWIGSPRPRVVPFRQHSCVNLGRIFKFCYVIDRGMMERLRLSYMFGGFFEGTVVKLDDVSRLNREEYMRQLFSREARAGVGKGPCTPRGRSR